MNSLNTKKVALTFGLCVSGMHLAWIILVAIGVAQPLLDFIFWAHMIDTIFLVSSFSLAAAVTLLVVTFIVGYLAGLLFGYAWNKVHTPRKQ